MVRVIVLILLVVGLALTGCGPRIQDYGVASVAPHLAPDALVAPDGARLPMRVWPAAGRTEAVVIALHGFNDYAQAFDGPGPWWAEHGLTIYAYDQRGFGSAPEPGIWAGVDGLTKDLHAAIVAVRQRHPGVPIYLLGSSMGASVAMAAIRRDDRADVAGLVLVAPAVWGRITMNGFYRFMLWFGVQVMPANKATGRALRIRPSDNIEMLRGLGRDPLIIKRTRIDAIYGLVNLMDAALAAAPEIRVPMLVLYGGRDELIPKGPVELMMSRLTGPYRVVVYRDGWHMLLRDLQAKTVWRDIAGWIKDPSAPLPSDEERRRLPLFAEN